MVQSEELRFRRMFQFEAELRSQGFARIAGVDEAGRGPLAGPVVAAACILPEGFFLAYLNDSKQLQPEKRKELYESLIAYPGIVYGISSVDVSIIDQINILQASLLAMQRAIALLSIQPDYLLIDGNQLPKTNIPARALVEGDARSISIAAASVLAKVARDAQLVELAKQYPQYGFEKHKGYATAEHLRAIELYGPCPIHRRTFEPIKSSLEPSLFDILKKKGHTPIDQKF